MAADVAQCERDNFKCYALVFKIEKNYFKIVGQIPKR